MYMCISCGLLFDWLLGGCWEGGTEDRVDGDPTGIVGGA